MQVRRVPSNGLSDVVSRGSESIAVWATAGEQSRPIQSRAGTPDGRAAARTPSQGKSFNSPPVAITACRRVPGIGAMTDHIRLADIDVAFTAKGDGGPVVLLHGLAEDRTSWQHVQDGLSGVRTYAYDLRGHGETSAGQGEGTLAQLGQDLIRFLEAVTGPAACIGFSLGGTVVIWAAAHRPDLFTRIALVGTSSIVGRKAGDFFVERIALLERDPTAFKTALRDDTAAQIASATSKIDAVTARRVAAVGDGQGYINAARAMRGVVDQPLTSLLERITCPVDVIGGEKDAFCPRKAADGLMRGLKSARYHEIEGAGHLMSVDNPERYLDVIATCLRPRSEA